MRTLTEKNVLRFWHEPDQNLIKVEMIHGILNLKKGDERIQDLKILDNNPKIFVNLFGKEINKNLVRNIKRILKPECCINILMKNGKQYKFDLKQRISRDDANLLDTFNYIKSLLN